MQPTMTSIGFKKQLSFLLLGLATATGCVGDQGEEGEMGAMGETGETGAQGETGAAGTACWDLNTNTTCDVDSEDKDKNGSCDVNDCAANGEGYILNNAGKPGAWQTASYTIHGNAKIESPYKTVAMTLMSDASWDWGSDQHNVLQLRSGSPMKTYAWFDNYGGFVTTGELGIGQIPTTGEGVRMMFYPFKAAFRAGGVGYTGNWDDANTGYYSFGGGVDPKASGNFSVALGYYPEATGQSAVALGNETIASGKASFAAGSNSTASGNFSVALGRNADASKEGSFVFADNNSTPISPLANNQFLVRASGGFRLLTNAGGTTGVSLNAGGSSWNVVSDRNAKEDFQSIDGEDLLARLANVEVSNWVYKNEDKQPRHIGPMAQDFYAAFGLGLEDTRINSLDLDGVNMAAVQALEIRTRELAHTTRQVAELKSEVQSLRADIERLEKLVIAQQQLAGAAR